MAVKFSATKLNGTGKRGVLTPDADGYYEIMVGGLNVFNSAGEFYTLKGAEQLFQESSTFMRRIRSGRLRSEVGHPKPGIMSYKEYVRRIFTIEETNVCAHFKDIWLDPTYGQNKPKHQGNSIVAILAKVKPAGPKGEALRQAFENPHEDVCFSIRAVTKDYYEGRQCYRILENVVTFDWVNEPGIAHAAKYDSPALENLSDQLLVEEVVASIATPAKAGFALEESQSLAKEVMGAFKASQTAVSVPNYHSW